MLEQKRWKHPDPSCGTDQYHMMSWQNGGLLWVCRYLLQPVPLPLRTTLRGTSFLQCINTRSSRGVSRSSHKPPSNMLTQQNGRPASSPAQMCALLLVAMATDKFPSLKVSSFIGGSYLYVCHGDTYESSPWWPRINPQVGVRWCGGVLASSFPPLIYFNIINTMIWIYNS